MDNKTGVPELKISPRVTIRPGSRVTLSGGPVYESEGRPKCVARLRGEFLVLGILRRGNRVWLEVRGLTQVSGTFTVYVSGRAYRRPDLPGILWRPFRVRRRRSQ
jgi:hypothetical protein